MPQPSSVPTAKTPQAGITVADIVRSGLLTPGARLRASYRGHDYEATVLPDGSIRWQGREFASPSTAAANVRLSVMGPKPGRSYPQTNGWTFWKIEGQPIDHLRKQLLARTRDSRKARSGASVGAGPQRR